MPRGTFRVGEDAFPLRQYVSRRVDVAVVVRTARGAVPRPHRQRQGVEPVPAGRAGLARRVEAADLDKGAPTLGALVLKQPCELAERGVRHSFRQMMVLHHALGIQVLHAQDLVLVREHGRDLVKGIGSGIGDLRVNPGDPLPLLQVPAARLLAPACALPAGKPALLPRELALVFLEVARVSDLRAVRESRERFDAEVDSDLPVGRGHVFSRHVGERVTAKVSNLPAGATQVSYQWQYSSTKTGTFSDIKYGGNTNSYEISEEDEDYYLRCKVTTSSSKGKVPDAYSETIGKVYVFDWSKYPTGSYRPRFNGNSLACCTAPYDSSTQIPSLGEGDYASIVFDNELSDIPQGNITYRWFKCAGLGSGAQLVAKELGSSPSLSLSGLQGSCINCEVTLTVNGKSKTFVPKAICNGKLSDGIYVRPRIG